MGQLEGARQAVEGWRAQGRRRRRQGRCSLIDGRDCLLVYVELWGESNRRNASDLHELLGGGGRVRVGRRGASCAMPGAAAGWLTLEVDVERLASVRDAVHRNGCEPATGAGGRGRDVGDGGVGRKLNGGRLRAVARVLAWASRGRGFEASCLGSGALVAGSRARRDDQNSRRDKIIEERKSRRRRARQQQGQRPRARPVGSRGLL